MRLFKFACKEGESLVYFDHVLDMVGCGYRLVVSFTHAYTLLALRWTRVRWQNRPLNGNHIQHVIKIYQVLPSSLHANLHNRAMRKGESLVRLVSRPIPIRLLSNK